MFWLVTSYLVSASVLRSKLSAEPCSTGLSPLVGSSDNGIRCCATEFGPQIAACDKFTCVQNVGGLDHSCVNYVLNATLDNNDASCPYQHDRAICDVSYYIPQNRGMNCRNQAGNCLGKVKCNTDGVNVVAGQPSNGTANGGGGACALALWGFEAGEDCVYLGSTETWKVCSKPLPKKRKLLAKSSKPSKAPTTKSTKAPTKTPTSKSTKLPTIKSTKRPTNTPTPKLTKFPTAKPTAKNSPAAGAPPQNATEDLFRWPYWWPLLLWPKPSRPRVPTTRKPTAFKPKPTKKPTTTRPTKPTRPTLLPTTLPTVPTNSPTTNKPSTKSPTTKSPTTKSPTTKSPTTNSPTTNSPTTKTPTKLPTTRSPTTRSPTTNSPTTTSPSTKSPTTRSPTTKSPTTNSPSTTSPTTKSPTTKSPTTTSPATHSPTSPKTTTSPTTKSPTTTSPTTRSPTTISPTTRSPSTISPTTRSPTTISPTTRSPSTISPTTRSPTTTSPTTRSPTTISPTTSSPTTASPTTSPTTISPSTSSPTTISPTTSPTTTSPTTISPTTSPTTDSPTTTSPTTESPTTTSPTTSPTTTSPTTDSPTTTSPTSFTPCATENGGCNTNAECTFSGGTRTCTCNAGYSGDGFVCSAPPPACSTTECTVQLGTPVFVNDPHNPRAPFVVDINQDGKLDILIANAESLSSTNPSGSLSVFFGNGDATLNPELYYTGPPLSSNAVVAADVNSDGWLDAITVNGQTNIPTSDGSISVFLNKGFGAPGTFFAPISYTTGSPASLHLCTGDFNADGRPDIATTSVANNEVSVLLNDGSGGFGAPTLISIQTTGGVQSTIACRDLDGDTNTDLVVTSPAAARISVLLCHGDGTFFAPVPYTNSVNGQTAGIAFGDADNDGKTDILSNGAAGRYLFFFKGHGDGTFVSGAANTAGSAAIANSALGLVAADLSFDGKLDALILVTTAAGGLLPMTGSGTGAFTSGTLVGTGFSSLNAIALGDMNRDGVQDVVLTQPSGSVIIVPTVQ